MTGTILSADEVQWLHPAIPLQLLWDDSLSSSNEASQTSILQGLLQQALTGPLLPSQQQQVLEQLQANPKRVFSCGLTPQRLPDLVELNPAIAIEVWGFAVSHAHKYQLLSQELLLFLTLVFLNSACLPACLQSPAQPF